MATTVSFATKYVAYIYWEKTLTYRGTPFPRSPNFCHATPVKRTLFEFIAKMFDQEKCLDLPVFSKDILNFHHHQDKVATNRRLKYILFEDGF